MIPPVEPVPGVKLGLANISYHGETMLVLGRKEAGAVLVVRLILGSAPFAGGFSGISADMAAAYLVMCLEAHREYFPPKAGVGRRRPCCSCAQRRPAGRGGLGLSTPGIWSMLRRSRRQAPFATVCSPVLRRHVTLPPGLSESLAINGVNNPQSPARAGTLSESTENPACFKNDLCFCLRKKR